MHNAHALTSQTATNGNMTGAEKKFSETTPLNTKKLFKKDC